MIASINSFITGKFRRQLLLTVMYLVFVEKINADIAQW